MHHYRATVNGPPAAVEGVLAELAREGVHLAACSDVRHVVFASATKVDYWNALSKRHRGARLSVESFAALEDEFVQIVVENGTSTVMASDPVLPKDFGSLHDDDGAPLDESLLRAAAERVADRRLDHTIGPLSSGLDTALAMGGTLGRVCGRVEATAFGDPPADAIDAVVELAVAALWVSACGRSLSQAECEFEHALRLTQSFVHAGRCEIAGRPGDPGWSDWLGLLLAGASDVIDAACMCALGPADADGAAAYESYCTPGEALELEACSLLTSCLQALALYSP